MHGAAIPSFDGDRRAVRLPAVSPPVRTARLQLAPVVEGDLEELFALHADPRAFTEDLTEPLTGREQMRWVLAQWIEHWAQHGAGYLTVRSREPSRGTLPSGLLGVVGLAPLEVDAHADLSAYWRVSPGVSGRGVATEAMHAVLGHPEIGARGREVLAVTAAGNAASRALAARLGFALAPASRPVPGGREGDVLLIRPA